MSVPVGFKCLELNIAEVDGILKAFVKKHRHMLNFDQYPSWKFPHMNIETLDVPSVIREYNARSLPEGSLYAELMEIFVDRLHFGLLGILEFLSSVGHSVSNHELSSSLTVAHYGQGDCGGLVDQGLPTAWESPVSVTKLDDADNKPIQIMMSVGEILKQIHSMLQLELLQGPCSLLPLAIQSKNPGELIMSEESGSAGGSCNRKKIKKLLPSFKSKSCQTELHSLEGCESCWLSQNMLRLIAKSVDECWTGISAGGSSSSTSRIRTLREGLKDTVWEYSQRGVILQWCEALEADTLVIKEKGEELAKNHLEQERTLEDLRKSSLMESKRMSMVIEELELKVKVAENDLNHEKKAKKKWIRQRDEAMDKANDKESSCNEKTKECERLEMDVKRLNEAIQRLEDAYKAEQSSHSKSSKEVGEMRKQLDSELEEKQSLSRKVGGLETQLDLKDQEIQELRQSLASYKGQQEEVKCLKKALEEYKEKVDELEASERMLGKVKERYTQEIKKLKEELDVSESKVELLTLYPDLNGPINPPSDDASNPVRTMELQVQSNLLRVEVLKSQSERLSNAMNKIRSRLKM